MYDNYTLEELRSLAGELLAQLSEEKRIEIIKCVKSGKEVINNGTSTRL